MSEWSDKKMLENAKTAIESITAMRDEIVRLRTALENNIGVVQPLKPYTALENELTRRSEWTTVESIQKAIAACDPIRTQNAAILESNLKIKEELRALLERTGVPASVKCGSSGTYRNPKAIYGGWDKSLAAIPSTDSWPFLMERAKEWMRAIEQEAEKKRRAAEDLQRAKDAEQKRIAQKAELLMLQNKYGCEEYQLFDRVRSRHKWLRLADAMQATRSDWSDGCYRVKDALSMFHEVGPEDDAIRKEIGEICADFDDGRSFRDCKYNYDWMFARIAQEAPDVHLDYQKLHAMREDLED